MDFNEGYIYFGTKKTNNCFDKENKPELLNKIICFYKDKDYSNTIKNQYIYLDKIHDKVCMKKKVIYSNITNNMCVIHHQLTKEPFFPCTTNYSYKLKENINFFKIHEKIFLNINQHNHIYIKFIKDSYYDEVEPILEKTINEIKSLQNT